MPPEPPAPIVPVPASQFPSLRGRRVIVGVPGLGFRPDLRADDPVVHGGRTYVPVLSELDYYRAEIEQVEVFAPLVPIDRVWVENVQSVDAAVRLVAGALDAPPERMPVPVDPGAAIIGRRLVQAVPDGHVRDLRGCTDAYLSSDGTLRVRTCTEADWYRWALQGTLPDATTELPAETLWLE